MASSKWPIVSRPRQRRNHFTHGSARREQFGATQHGPIQLVCVKVPLFRQVRTRRALPAVSPGATGSNEGESQKAGAKKGKSRRGQGKKAIGNEVLISHHTPSDLDARWNLLKLSERAFSKQAIHASAQVKPVNGFRQTHGPGRLRRRPNPSLPSLSQTLPTSFAPLRDRERRRPCTVKKISRRQHTIAFDRGFCATRVSKPGRLEASEVPL